MILTALILSLQIIAIHLLFEEGMMLGKVRIAGANMLDKYLGKKWSMYVQKPIWDCYMCMSSVWTIILTGTIDIPLMLLVCGLNLLIYKTFLNDEDLVGS